MELLPVILAIYAVLEYLRTCKKDKIPVNWAKVIACVALCLIAPIIFVFCCIVCVAMDYNELPD